MKTRRLKLNIGSVEACTGWSDSKLTFTQYPRHSDEARREAVILIERPSDVEEIRRALNNIVAYWRNRMEDV